MAKLGFKPRPSGSSTAFLSAMFCSFSFCKPCHIPLSLTQVQFSLPSRPERTYIPLFSLLHRILWDFQTIVVSEEKMKGGCVCAGTVVSPSDPPAARWHTSALCLWAGHRGAPPKAWAGARTSPRGSHQLLWRPHAQWSDYSTHRPLVRSSAPSCRRDRRRTSLRVDHPSFPRESFLLPSILLLTLSAYLPF